MEGFKYQGVEVKVIFIDKMQIEDLAFMAGVAGKPLFWHDGVAILVLSMFLDVRTLTRRFLENGALYVEHVFYGELGEYKPVIRVIRGDLAYSVPVLKAAGLLRALCEHLKGRRS